MPFDLKTARPVYPSGAENGRGFDLSSAKPVETIGGRPVITVNVPPEKPLRPLGQRIVHGAVENLPLIGGIAGGMLGSVPGGAVGGELGTIAKQGIEGLYYGKPMTTGGMLKEQALQSGGMAAGESVGRYALDPALKYGATKAARFLWPAKEGAAEAQALLRAHGGTLSAGQAVKGGVPATTEKLASLGIFGRPVYERLSESNQGALQSARDELINQYSKIPAETIAKRSGTLVQDVLKSGDQAFSGAADKMYSDFSNQVLEKTSNLPMGGRTVDMGPIRAWAQRIADQYARVGKAAPAVIQDALRTPSNVTFADAQFDRSLALKRLRDLQTGTSKDTASLAYYKELQGKILGQMDSAAQKLDPELYKQYRQISDFYRRGKEAFGNDVVLGLLDKNPEKVAESLYASGNVSEITQLKATLRAAKRLDPKLDTDTAWNNLRGSYLNQLFLKSSMRGAEGDVKGAALQRSISEAKNLRTMNALFGRDDAQKIAKLVSSMRVAQSPMEHGGGLEMAIPLGQGAAIGALVRYGVAGAAGYGAYKYGGASPEEAFATAGVVLMTPRVLAKLMTNPETVNALVGLQRMSRADPKFIPLLSKVIMEETAVKNQLAAQTSAGQGIGGGNGDRNANQGYSPKIHDVPQ